MYSNVYSYLRLFWNGGAEIRRNRSDLEKTQWLSPSELREWQFTRITALLRHAYENVPFYQKRYRELGIHPEDIKSFAEFEKLPFLTRQDVIDHVEDMVDPEWRCRVRADSTSGSTGEPLRFFIDGSYDWWDWALELRGRGWYGVRQGDKTAMVWGAQRDIHDRTWRARLKTAATRERYLNAYGMTGQRMEEYAHMLLRWQPPLIRGYPSALTLFAEYMRRRNIPTVRPKVIETTAEKLTDTQREVLEETFRCPVADWYTTREFGTITYQCPARGVHVCETRHLEVIADGAVAQPGQLGEIAITSLNQYGMPFIRYKIGDMAIAHAGQCSCGRGMPLLEDVVGRRQELLVTKDGRRIYSGFITYTFRMYPVISHFQVYQPDTSHIRVRLVLRHAGDTGDSSWVETLRQRLRDQLGTGMEIEISIVDRIELTAAGKQRPIISDVASAFM